MEIDENKYLSSKETMKALKVSSCDLMHLRVSGKLKFIKKGNAYFYEKS
ncbi:helix-turn-helix domain-containing protein [Aquimarina algiphila]|uniref:Helix-turn-helix domain-containing protein n=1 Tax=Aquimarina algiphila TaxID=2047982 RepID=A0A554VBT6_9FLAO|nr:helix-turn-helix domain-containing protein [Aquimarina algiphila]